MQEFAYICLPPTLAGAVQLDGYFSFPDVEQTQSTVRHCSQADPNVLLHPAGAIPYM